MFSVTALPKQTDTFGGRSWQAGDLGVDLSAEMPRPAPLDMPRQHLSLRPAGDPHIRQLAGGALGWRRLVALGGTAGLSLSTGGLLTWALSSQGVTPLEYALLGLFVMLFAWTAFSAVTALAGFALLIGHRRAAPADRPGPASLRTRTAILAPLFNEDIDAVVARIEAMHEALVEAGVSRHFAFFVLSDSNVPAIAREERVAIAALRRRARVDRGVNGLPIYYRRRSENVERKSGNIADWVRAHGGAYEHMMVLDADSLIEAETMIELVRAMEREPHTGLIQTCSTSINGQSLLARTQQFANRLYGPIFSAGLAWWSGREANYWGHNAIIRVRAFAQCAGLPRMRGPRPFGGEILSHDFVEAALLRRAGWGVRFDPYLGGSYEETPPSLIDLMIRDRRWCQGNLQHLPIIAARGLHWVSRLHLLRGASAYLTAPLWLVFLVIGVLVCRETGHMARPGAGGHMALTAAIFAGSMFLLFLPKLLACAVAISDRTLRQGYGGLRRLCASVVAEIVLSTLIAPVMMLTQTKAVIEVLAGRDAGWRPQRRTLDGLSAGEALRFHGWHMAYGVLLCAAALTAAPALLLWMAPVILGLVLAAPLSMLTAGKNSGQAARRLRLLLTPEETAPPPVVRRAQALTISPRWEGLIHAPAPLDAMVRRSAGAPIDVEFGRLGAEAGR
jgi:membrane glycosyltransferase